MKKILLMISSVCLALSLTACGARKLYDQAVVNEVKSNSGEVLLKEAVIKAKSTEVNKDVLTDIYYNYFVPNELNLLTIVYTDKDEKLGTILQPSVIITDGVIEKVYDKYHFVWYSEDSKRYYPSNGTLTE